jgi:hypothetical protein
MGFSNKLDTMGAKVMRSIIKTFSRLVMLGLLANSIFGCAAKTIPPSIGIAIHSGISGISYQHLRPRVFSETTEIASFDTLTEWGIDTVCWWDFDSLQEYDGRSLIVRVFHDSLLGDTATIAVDTTIIDKDYNIDYIIYLGTQSEYGDSNYDKKISFGHASGDTLYITKYRRNVRPAL